LSAFGDEAIDAESPSIDSKLYHFSASAIAWRRPASLRQHKQRHFVRPGISAIAATSD